MPMIFYPHQDELESSTIEQKLEVLMESAERYKAIVLDMKLPETGQLDDSKKRTTPREIAHVYNWEELAKVLRQIRESPESTSANKITKSGYLNKLAGIYEVLRGAKMSKLEAVRLALVNEANQLRSGSSQVA
jgi:hypothetical protein